MIARGGRLLVLLTAATALTLFPFEPLASAVFAGLTVFLLFVFRDPSRSTGGGVVAPADGTVREVDRANGLVSIYLALWNVHVTRAPLAGRVSHLVRHVGSHAPAFSVKSPGNMRIEVAMETDIGRVTATLMTGMIARRIVPYVDSGSVLAKADRLGLIMFGSRVDLILPPDKVAIKAEVGQKVRAGETCIAEVADDRAG